MDELLTIGEFARATQLSLRALWLYGEKGLLVPIGRGHIRQSQGTPSLLPAASIFREIAHVRDAIKTTL